MSSLVWLVMLLAHATTLVTSTSTDENISDEYKSIFILAGQSNMAGRASIINGTYCPPKPPLYNQTQRIVRLTANLTWEEARDPLHYDIDYRPCGVGPGLKFANSLLNSTLNSTIGVIGLVPCAVGGTSISDWSKGKMLYNQMLRRAQAAVRCGGGEIRAMLWYQGEADAVREEDAKNYKCKLEKFFNDVRADLQLPDLPIIQVALASNVTGNYTDEVRKAQLGIRLPNVRCVDAWGLEGNPGDLVHLTTKSQVKVGEMLAGAFLNLTATGQSCA